MASKVDPRCRVLYVDVDLLVGAHARALLTSEPGGAVVFVPGDLEDIDAVLADPVVRDTLDLSRPVAVLLLAVLHFLPGRGRARRVVERLGTALPMGSYLAVSHVTFDPLRPAHADRLRELSAPGAGHGPFRARRHAEIMDLLDGFELEWPRLGPVVQWRPEREPRPVATVEESVAYGVVARTAGIAPWRRSSSWGRHRFDRSASAVAPNELAPRGNIPGPRNERGRNRSGR
ncbi:S-adenosyl methyltransferase [Pseudosporangium ferrugineum]|uniref:S-adenosyl methyltransferase n=1 Tax=Pseudosporangium ferrugineum TaxID=439699 RepID=A0A2T0S228_9ACTN|nr:S-adenosyl methyltransferase [Pseudosporangium ferrugineum]